MAVNLCIVDDRNIWFLGNDVLHVHWCAHRKSTLHCALLWTHLSRPVLWQPFAEACYNDIYIGLEKYRNIVSCNLWFSAIRLSFGLYACFTGDHWEIAWSTCEQFGQKEISHSQWHLHLAAGVDYTQKSSPGIGKGALFVCRQNHSIVKVFYFSIIEWCFLLLIFYVQFRVLYAV